MEGSSGLRQRKPSGAAAPSTKHPTEEMVETLANSVPVTFKPYLQSAAPFVGITATVLEKVLTILITLYHHASELWIKLKPYRLDLLLPSFLGIIMIFFGGKYMTIIAAIEAYKLIGYDTTIKCLKDIYDDTEKLIEANKADNLKDDNNDGVPDVEQINSKELTERKFYLALRTLDPQKLSTAFGGLNAGFFAVVATLKLQFAKSITLGNAIGSIVERPALVYIVPVLENCVSDEYKKWTAPTVSYIIRSSAISFAWLLQRIITAIHSAVRGGNMFGKNILEYCREMGYINIKHEETHLDEIIGYVLAATGVWFQLSTAFGLPFPLDIILLPFTCLEWWLMWIVSSK